MTQNISFGIKIQVDLANISHLDKKSVNQEIQKIIDNIYDKKPNVSRIIAVKNLEIYDYKNEFLEKDQFIESTNMKIFRKKRELNDLKNGFNAD
tara:strand:+ start:631 stop:912 length:282 start_codon:yes stop_codon:yes gene_type:complete